MHQLVNKDFDNTGRGFLYIILYEVLLQIKCFCMVFGGGGAFLVAEKEY